MPAVVLVGLGQDVALVEQPAERLASTTRGPGRTAPCARSGRTAGAARRARRRRRTGRRRRRRPARCGPIQYRSTSGSTKRVLVGRVAGSAARTSTSRPTAASRWSRGGSASARRPGRARRRPTSPAGRAAAPGSEISSSGSNVRGEKSSSVGQRRPAASTSGSAIGQAGLVVDDRERLAPVALAAEQPVAQLVGDRCPRRGRRPPASRSWPAWRRPRRARPGPRCRSRC